MLGFDDWEGDRSLSGFWDGLEFGDLVTSALYTRLSLLSVKVSCMHWNSFAVISDITSYSRALRGLV